MSSTIPRKLPVGEVFEWRGRVWRKGRGILYAAEPSDKRSSLVTGHWPGCKADYPEKLLNEPPQALSRIRLEGKEWIDICVDCGGIIRHNKGVRR